VNGFSLPFTGPIFNEFVVRGPGNSVELLSRLAKEKQIEGGIALSRFMPDREKDFLVCVTETNTREQIDSLVAALSAL
jgi:glycine dehydrogenase subunit 1